LQAGYDRSIARNPRAREAWRAWAAQLLAARVAPPPVLDWAAGLAAQADVPPHPPAGFASKRPNHRVQPAA
jgi:hypothetical protein